MNWSELRSLAKPVSRSFYLTLLTLPADLRPPITLAYLLARFSDTIADVNAEELPARIQLLESLRNAPAKLDLQNLGIFTTACKATKAEQHLISSWPALIQAFQKSSDRETIRTVWHHILAGQIADLQRESQGKAHLPLSWEEVIHYAYQVAGSVGEFWTEIGMKKDPLFASLPVTKMRKLGCSYGIALQLINICRDRKNDAIQGRCYLAEEDLPAAFQTIRKGLADGEQFTNALQNRRLFFASSLPRIIAQKMLPALLLGLPSSKLSRRKIYQLFTITALHTIFLWKKPIISAN